MRGKCFIVPLVVYPFDVMVSIGQTDKEFRKALEGHLPKSCWKDLESDQILLTLPGTTQGRTINFEIGHQTVLRLKRSPQTADEYGTLGHEIFHAVEMIFFRMGITHHFEHTGEVYAYMIGYLTTEIFKNLK